MKDHPSRVSVEGGLNDCVLENTGSSSIIFMREDRILEEALV